MSAWILSVTETNQLRRAHDAYPEATVYRKDNLMALVYRETKNHRRFWHLMLTVKGGERPPEVEDAVEACDTLLPAQNTFAIALGKIRSDEWQGDVPCFHAVSEELTEVTKQ